MSTRFPHSADYFPPIPALIIGVRARMAAICKVRWQPSWTRGLTSPSSQITLFESVGAPEMDEVRLRSHWGERTTVTTYLIDIQLGGDILPGIEVVGDLHSRDCSAGTQCHRQLLLLMMDRT